MNIGLVLAGGMAKGAYQIGVLKAIDSFVPREMIKYISCASVGVLNGYAYAAGNLEQGEAMWRDICKGGDKLLITRVLKSNLLQEYIGDLYQPGHPLWCKFYASLMDLGHRNIVYKELSGVPQEQIPLYLKASVAMPVYNRSVSIDETTYYDGAVIDNIPVYPLLKHDLDYMICVYYDENCSKFENTEVDNRIIKITFPGDGVLKRSVVFSQESIDTMIQEGYDRAMFLLSSVFAKGYNNLEHIYRMIQVVNHNNKNTSFRITGDVLVTNINRIVQKLTKKRIL